MASIAYLLRLLITEPRITPEKVAADPSGSTDVRILKSGTLPMVQFTLGEYHRFYTTVIRYEAGLPESVKSKFRDVTSMPTLTGSKPVVRGTSATTRFGHTVLMPWQMLATINDWLHGKMGKEGHLARNSLEREFFPERFVKVPHTATGGYKLPSIKRATPAEQLQFKLHMLERVFDVVIVRPSDRLPKLEHFRALTADGEDRIELFDPADFPTLWVLRDEREYYAVMLGPEFGLAHELRVRSSMKMFHLPAIAYKQLRPHGLQELLEPAHDGPRTGWLQITSSGKRIGTLVSLHKFFKLCGLD